MEQDLQKQIDNLQSQLDDMSSSSRFPVDVEFALRERLNLANIVQAYPIGSIFVSTVSTDPSTLLGYGTWTAYATGQVLVGYSSGDPDFGTLGVGGGEKNHTLTITEMPQHGHTAYVSTASPGPVLSGGPTSPSITLGTTSLNGSGVAHNNLQPFMTVMFWKRTA